MNKLKNDVVILINDIIEKVERLVPETGGFDTVYSEYKNIEKDLCLTDVMLKVEAVPAFLDSERNQRYLTCVGYKLPIPIKSTLTMKKGTKSEILAFLRDEISAERISEKILQLDYNLQDV